MPAMPDVLRVAQPVHDRVRRSAAARTCSRGRLRRSRSLRRAVPDVEDEHVGADEEHDQPLDDVGEVAGELGLDHARLQAVRRAEEERAEEERARGPTPTAVLRPSSATAMPRKPTVDTGMSETPKW